MRAVYRLPPRRSGTGCLIYFLPIFNVSLKQKTNSNPNDSRGCSCYTYYHAARRKISQEKTSDGAIHQPHYFICSYFCVLHCHFPLCLTPSAMPTIFDVGRPCCRPKAEGMTTQSSGYAIQPCPATYRLSDLLGPGLRLGIPPSSGHRLRVTASLTECHVFVKVVEFDVVANFLGPFLEAFVACYIPRQQFDTPSKFVHSFEISVEAFALGVTCTVSCHQHRDARWLNVDNRPKHMHLETLIDSLLCARIRTTFVKLNLYSG